MRFFVKLKNTSITIEKIVFELNETTENDNREWGSAKENVNMKVYQVKAKEKVPRSI